MCLVSNKNKMHMNQTLVNIMTLVTGLILRDLVMEAISSIRNKPGNRLLRVGVTLLIAVLCVLLLVYFTGE